MSPGIRARLAMGLVVGASLLAVASPASACTPPTGGVCGDSTLNVVLAAGTLSLSVPASVSLSGTLGASPSFSTTMGTITIQDNRGAIVPAGWTLSALTSGNLTTGGASPQTISLGTSTVGGPLVLSPGTITAGTGASLVGVTSGASGSLNPSQALTVARAVAGSGAGSYTMTPSLTLTPPSNVVAGAYTTTITYSLS